MSRSTKTRASGEKRVRREFTVSEDQELIKFLAGYDPNTRLSMSTYRDVAVTSWGSTHSAPSWLARYKRSQALFDVRIDGLILKNTGSVIL
ncbi:hypothetical protein C8R43DRAFT_242562 [Mycena crocata]|nr:hypothetical protein C8R43DRAFT_242562 [Mycena crocata]